MLRTPSSNIDRAVLENASPEELLGMFESGLSSGSRVIAPDKLAEAWGVLFTGLYLSAEDLIDEMSDSGDGLSGEKRQMLREFIRDDCKRGGGFVLEVIQRGGKIDRAALVMVADAGNIASVNWQGTTALHMLAEAIDKGIRPVLIRRCGKDALSTTYDARGIPPLIAILSIGDLRKADLQAIKDVFQKDELRKVRNKNGTGRSAHDIYMEAAGRLSRNAPQERNKFGVSHAVKDTRMERGLKKQLSADNRTSDMFGNQRKDDGKGGMSQRYSEMMQDPLDNIDMLRRQIKRKR